MTDARRRSKFLSLVLRHEPQRIGIVLDSAGWTDVAGLLAACAAHGMAMTRDQLAEVVATSDKQRFALSDDGARIRANQGHSVDVELELAPATPPDVLYHGTADRFLDSIRAQGLVKQERHHVHLSATREVAIQVGARHGRPVVLVVRAAAMVAAGHAFYRSANGVWLVDHVPAAFLDFPADADTPERRARATIARETIAAIDAGGYTNARGERVAIAVAAARDGTVLHELDLVDRVAPVARHATRVAVTAETTVAAIARLGEPVGVLNFASARNPGGGFLGGAQAQEEALARSSALYSCLCAQPSHYERNRAHRSAIYLDLAVWSPEVPFFRDDAGGWLDGAIRASVITCAAPNAHALRQHGNVDVAELAAALERRAALVLAVAVHHRVDRLVLGAWGAGVFGNDPVHVARVFAAHLRGRFAGAFADVVFAVPDAAGANHRAFADTFAA